jgi:16S rRNA processing protein RimM
VGVGEVTPKQATPAMLPAGRVGRAHGLDGSFYVTGAQPRLLVLGTLVEVGERGSESFRRAAIVRRAGIDARPIVRLQGIEGRSQAEALRGLPLAVVSAEAPRLGEGEWWAHELEGCEVCDGERSLGRVTRLIALPSCEALQVTREDGRELLVPMVRDAIRKVDVPAERVEVSLEFLGDTWT